MAEDGDRDAVKPSFGVELRPFAETLHLISQGQPENIDPQKVAKDLRANGFADVPKAVESWLCDYLEGKIETRGRKGRSPLENRLLGLHAGHVYSAIRKAQKNDPEALPEAVNAFEQFGPEVADGYSPSEAAWMIVSILIYGHSGHHKRLKNLAGKAKSKGKKNARN